LNNILSNAVKYTKKGTVTLSVSSPSTESAFIIEGSPSVANDPLVKAVRDNETILRFVVQDTGIGIREEDMDKLFSGYTQLDTKANRMIEGTGLGLEITKNLVEMMGGSVVVESEYGKGSVFTVTLVQELLPSAEGTDSAVIGEEVAENLRNFRYVSDRKRDDFVPASMPHGKVLIVDDVPINIMVVEGLLEPYGLTVDSVLSGQEAIEKIIFEEHYYDLVFMDHMMPGMDGIETTKVIRAWEKEQAKRQIPIIALTANALAGNIDIFLSAGFDGFISKPIDIAQIDEALNKWVRDKQSHE
jgi:CheY-like chemotaxis protein